MTDLAPATPVHRDDDGDITMGAAPTNTRASTPSSSNTANPPTHDPSIPVSVASSVSGTAATPSNNNSNSNLSFSQPLTAKKGPQSFFSGSKIKHLKKADGIPLWRVDIQYDFLQAVFKDTQPVFTNTYSGQKDCTFADIYVDAMARSSKTSKILRDKLNSERENALNMAMVCLLVNVGRMNTTLNFFPEMKAQLRTYHAIPSLQAHTDSNAYKQLQDAPRLKSILKGACEDRKEPQTLDQINSLPHPPRTNPINLVFILSTYAPKITEVHFPHNLDFYDLIMRSTLSSKSRARAFLWLMWYYLESDFSQESTQANPYGPGLPCHKDKADLRRVPDFEPLTEEQAAKENVDTALEKDFGELKREERKRLLGDLQNAPTGLGRGRGRKSTALAASPDVQSPSGSPPTAARGRGPRSRYYSETHDTASSPFTRSVSPSATPISKRRTKTDPSMPDSFRNKGGRPKGSTTKRTLDGELKAPQQRIILKSAGKVLGQSGSPDPHIKGTPRLTSHQQLVQQNRQERIQHIIDRKLQARDKQKRKQRLRTGAIARAWNRIKKYKDPLIPSDAEENYDEPSEAADLLNNLDANGDPLPPAKRRRTEGRYLRKPLGPAGLVPCEEEIQCDDNDDFGEEALSLAAAIRRTKRRLERWEAQKKQAKPSAKLEDDDAEGEVEDDDDEGEVPVQSEVVNGNSQQQQRNGVENGDAPQETHGERQVYDWAPHSDVDEDSDTSIYSY